MPAFIPFSNCAEAVIRGSESGGAAYLTLGVQSPTAWAGSALQDLADLIADWTTGSLLGLLHNSWTVNDVKVSDLTTQFSPVVFSTSGLPASGGVSGSATTDQVCAVVSFRTAQRGRSFRGRNYVPAVPSSVLQTTSTITTAFATALEAAYADLATNLALAGLSHVILSRQENNVRRTVGVATFVTQYRADIVIGTQRRRVLGHGI